MNSWNDRNLEFDDFGLDEYESPFGSCSGNEDWDEDEWEEEEEDEDGEPPRELTPEQREKMNKNLQKILKEAEQKSKEICKGKIFTYRGIPLCKKTRLMNLWKQ